ncbi:MAG: ABC transporter substrate-binding protein [Reyranella sp.]
MTAGGHAGVAVDVGGKMLRSVWICAATATIVCATATGGYAEDVVDQRARRFVFTSPAERIVFLPMPAPSTYIAIDGTERRIVGMNLGSATAMRDGILGRLFPGMRSIPTDVTSGAGFMPNIEAILALRPDTVFQWATAGKDPIEMLDRAGLRTLGIRYGTQEDMAGYVEMMGLVAGKPERAAEIMRRQEERLEAITGAMTGLTDRQKPRVLSLGRTTDRFSAAGAGGYTDFYIQLAGGRNVAASERLAPGGVTLEQILTWDPEVVLLGNFDSAMPANLYADPRWQGVAAVRARRVYRVPLGGYRWDPPSLESALTWTWLAGLLQPDRTTFDLRADMRAWYRLLYGHELGDPEIDSILFAAANAGSVGYERYGKR